MRRILAVSAISFMVSAPLRAQASAAQINSLRALPGVVVDYGLFGESGTLELDSVEVRTTLEVELRRNGISAAVFDPKMSRADLISRGLLSYRLLSSRTADGHVFFSVLQLSQVAVLPRSGTSVSATTWEARGILRSVPPGSDGRAMVLAAVRQQVDEFVNAFLTANPR